jgi:hypothetical protein
MLRVEYQHTQYLHAQLEFFFFQIYFLLQEWYSINIEKENEERRLERYF